MLGGPGQQWQLQHGWLGGQQRLLWRSGVIWQRFARRCCQLQVWRCAGGRAARWCGACRTGLHGLVTWCSWSEQHHAGGCTRRGLRWGGGSSYRSFGRHQCRWHGERCVGGRVALWCGAWRCGAGGHVGWCSCIMQRLHGSSTRHVWHWRHGERRVRCARLSWLCCAGAWQRCISGRCGVASGGWQILGG